jgi:hypothetical protein
LHEYQIIEIVPLLYDRKKALLEKFQKESPVTVPVMKIGPTIPFRPMAAQTVNFGEWSGASRNQCGLVGDQ